MIYLILHPPASHPLVILLYYVFWSPKGFKEIETVSSAYASKNRCCLFFLVKGSLYAKLYTVTHQM